MDLDRVDESVVVGTTEISEVRSRNPYPHNFHINDVQFEILSIDGDPPPPELTGRKDGGEVVARLWIAEHSGCAAHAVICGRAGLRQSPSRSS